MGHPLQVQYDPISHTCLVSDFFGTWAPLDVGLYLLGWFCFRNSLQLAPLFSCQRSDCVGVHACVHVWVCVLEVWKLFCLIPLPSHPPRHGGCFCPRSGVSCLHCIKGRWSVDWISEPRGLCESGGGRPGLPVPNSPDGLCGRKAAKKNDWTDRLLVPSAKGHNCSLQLQLSKQYCLFFPTLVVKKQNKKLFKIVFADINQSYRYTVFCLFSIDSFVQTSNAIAVLQHVLHYFLLFISAVLIFFFYVKDVAQNQGVEINLNAVLFKICVGSPRVIEIAM